MLKSDYPLGYLLLLLIRLPRPKSIITWRFYFWYFRDRYCSLYSPQLCWGLNGRSGTIIWLILLAVGIVLGFDGYIFYHMRFENAFWTVATAVFLIAFVAYAIILMYIFPLLARFDNTIGAMFKNSIMLGMRFPLCTTVMAVIYFAMVFVIINVFTPIIIFGEGLCALLCSYLLSNILLLCQEKQEENIKTNESDPL